MRSLKLLMALIAGGATALAGGAFSAPALQTPPAKKSPAGQTGKSPATAPSKQAAAPAKQTPPPAKQSVPTKAPAKQPAPSPLAKSEQAAPSAPSSDGASQISVSPEMSPGNRRDPFRALVSSRPNTRQTAEVTCRAPGKGSIAIDTMRIDGLVRSGEGMIAAVRTPQGRVYFLREGDKLCDGRVERITLEGMTLRQASRDAFGRGVDRPVSKRLFPSAGE